MEDLTVLKLRKNPKNKRKKNKNKGGVNIIMKDWEITFYLIIAIIVGVFLLAGGWKILLIVLFAAMGGA